MGTEEEPNTEEPLADQNQDNQVLRLLSAIQGNTGGIGLDYNSQSAQSLGASQPLLTP
jgi:hypothetical protein